MQQKQSAQGRTSCRWSRRTAGPRTARWGSWRGAGARRAGVGAKRRRCSRCTRPPAPCGVHVRVILVGGFARQRAERTRRCWVHEQLGCWILYGQAHTAWFRSRDLTAARAAVSMSTAPQTMLAQGIPCCRVPPQGQVVVAVLEGGVGAQHELPGVARDVLRGPRQEHANSIAGGGLAVAVGYERHPGRHSGRHALPSFSMLQTAHKLQQRHMEHPRLLLSCSSTRPAALTHPPPTTTGCSTSHGA